jgi:phosphatidate phosphatase PAH1
MQGTSDIIVVRWRTGELKCTPFLACFGSHPSSTLNPIINIYINHALIPCLSKFFYLDKYGYMNPKFP